MPAVALACGKLKLCCCCGCQFSSSPHLTLSYWTAQLRTEVQAQQHSQATLHWLPRSWACARASSANQVRGAQCPVTPEWDLNVTIRHV